MTLRPPTEYHLESLSLKRGCTGSSESTHVKYHIIGNYMSRLIQGSAAAQSKAMDLLLFVHCLLLFPLGVGGGGLFWAPGLWCGSWCMF